MFPSSETKNAPLNSGFRHTATLTESPGRSIAGVPSGITSLVALGGRHDTIARQSTRSGARTGRLDFILLWKRMRSIDAIALRDERSIAYSRIMWPGRIARAATDA